MKKYEKWWNNWESYWLWKKDNVRNYKKTRKDLQMQNSQAATGSMSPVARQQSFDGYKLMDFWSLGETSAQTTWGCFSNQKTSGTKPTVFQWQKMSGQSSYTQLNANSDMYFYIYIFIDKSKTKVVLQFLSDATIWKWQNILTKNQHRFPWVPKTQAVTPSPSVRRDDVNRKSRSGGAVSAVPPPSSTSTVQRLGRHTVKGAVTWKPRASWLVGWCG